MWFELGPEKKTLDKNKSKSDWNKEGIYFMTELTANIWNRNIPFRDGISLSVAFFSALSVSIHK